MLMTKKPDLLDKIIIVKEGMYTVRELIRFFTGKLKIIHGKVKILSQGIKLCIPPILVAGNKLKDWQEWLDSFDSKLTQVGTTSIFEGDIDIPFNNFIDSLFKIEIDLN